MRTARPYQTAAIQAVNRAWQAHRSTLIVMATGTGKTYTAMEVVKAQPGRTLWLAHRSELIAQARDAAKAAGIGVETEQAMHRAAVHGLWGERLVVGSVATLRGPRLARWPRSAFTTIVVDEAHHSPARSYRQILDHFSAAKVLGLTATPDRGDGVGLASVFRSCAFEYDIRTAIGEGYLAPIRQLCVEVDDLDISDLKTVRGDIDQRELEARLSLDGVLHQVAVPLVEHAGGRPTIVFTAGVAQAKALAGVLGGYVDPNRVSTVDGKTPTAIRHERLTRFRAGSIQFMLNCAVLTEGFDAPLTSCIGMVRPTKSRALYAQCIGRGTRPAPNKQDCLVLDFQGNSGRHKLVTPIDVLAGKPLPDQVKARATALAADMPSDEALAKAEAEAEERERAAEARRRSGRKLRARVTHRARRVDPFADPTPRPGPKPTDAQARALRAVGFRGAAPTKREASRLLDEATRRRKAGLCTVRQAYVLARYGYDIEVTMSQASSILDALAANGWRRPSKLATGDPV